MIIISILILILQYLVYYCSPYGYANACTMSFVFIVYKPIVFPFGLYAYSSIFIFPPLSQPFRWKIVRQMFIEKLHLFSLFTTIKKLLSEKKTFEGSNIIGTHFYVFNIGFSDAHAYL